MAGSGEGSAGNVGENHTRGSAGPAGASGLQMPPEEMRRLGYRVVDSLVARWTELDRGPAREWAGNPERGTVYLSDQGHSSLERAARIAGIPRERVRKVTTGTDFRMVVEALRKAVRRDRDAGLYPFCVCANAGATNTGAIDPLRDIARVAEEADSVTLDPHKWLFQPYETGCLMVRDTGILEDAFRVLPEYLQDVDLGREQVNFADRGVQLTRRFRALKVWMSIQMLGLGAFRRAIAEGIELTEVAKEHIRASRGLELTGETSLGIVCFRFNPSGLEMAEGELEELNRSIQDEILAEGLTMMSSTRLEGRFSLRLAILNYRSTRKDVLAVLEAVKTLGDGKTGGSGIR